MKFAEGDRVTGTSFETVVLEKIRYQVREVVGAQLLADMRLQSEEAFSDYLGRTLALRLEVDLLGKEVRTEIHDGEHVPVTWWDHVKRDALPKWLKKRLPRVNLRPIEKKVVHYHLCPHSNRVCLEDEHIRFLIGHRR